MAIEESLTLRGVIITRESLEQRYNCKLTDGEWMIFRTNILKSWKDSDDELKRLAFKHIKLTFDQMDFKLELIGKQLVFTKK